MANNDRKPQFELHIRPMIRLLDFEKMKSITGTDLWDYQSVVDKAEIILRHLRADMPPESYGGLWPREWVAVFERWMNTECSRLDLGVWDTPLSATRVGGTVTLLGTTQLPHETYNAWLQPELVDGQWRQFWLYWQPPEEQPEPPLNPRQELIEEIVTLPTTVTEITIHDLDGTHQLSIAEGPDGIV